MLIDWTKIKDSIRGFEILALSYVKDNIDKHIDWELTQATRDDNKMQKLFCT